MFVAHSKFAKHALFCGAVLALAAPNLCLALGATQTTLKSFFCLCPQTGEVGGLISLSCKTYPTISLAVAAVSSGATILICPGLPTRSRSP